MKNPLRLVVMEDIKCRKYPNDVKKFMLGLYATLHLTDNIPPKELEKLVFLAFRNGYELGAAHYGGDAQRIHERLPDYYKECD